MIEGPVHPEDMTMLNAYGPNNGVPDTINKN